MLNQVCFTQAFTLLPGTVLYLLHYVIFVLFYYFLHKLLIEGIRLFPGVESQ